MKVKIVVELDVPEFDEWTPGEISQCLFDAYTNYATCKHFEDSVKWCAKARVGSGDEDAVARSIYEHHNTWGEICRKARVAYEIDNG